MLRIPEKDQKILEQAIYLPLVLTVLNQDLLMIERVPFKLKQPYVDLIEAAIIAIQKELAKIKRYMKVEQMKVKHIKSSGTFTIYLFFYKGYQEQQHYFNPRLRNRTEEIMRYYLYERFSTHDTT